MMSGGGSRTRTGDIRLAKPTLYQLSYAPLGRGRRGPAAVLSVLEDSSFSFWEARRASPPRHVSPGPGPDRFRPGAEQTN